MKLEKGKFYKTRSGEKVECLTTDVNGEYNCLFIKNDGLLFSVTSEGFYHINKKASLSDIISEWSDVEIPWEDYPKWCKSIDKYNSLGWSMYDKNGLFMGFIPSEYAPKGFTGDWKESKFERPKND